MICRKILLILALASTDAFTPVSYSPKVGRTPGLRMAQASPPGKGGEVCLAKRQALEANKKNWGITEAITPSASSSSSSKPTSQVNLAKKGALEANRENWGITGPISASSTAQASSPKPTGTAYRKITKDELRAMLQKLDGMTQDKAFTAMQNFGYTGALAQDLWTAVESARKNGVPLEAYEQLLAEADALDTKAKQTKYRADALRTEGAASFSKISNELDPKIREVMETLKTAEADAAQWSWFPFHPSKQYVDDLQRQQSDLNKQIQELRVAGKECDAGATALMGAYQIENADASAKRMEGSSLKAKALSGAQDTLIADLESKLAMWEGMSQKGSTGEVLKAMGEKDAKQLLFDLAIEPSPLAGTTSLSGRVYALMNPQVQMNIKAAKGAMGDKKAVAAAGSKAVATDDEPADSGRRTAIGLVFASLLGGGGYFAYQKGAVTLPANLTNNPIKLPKTATTPPPADEDLTTVSSL